MDCRRAGLVDGDADEEGTLSVFSDCIPLATFKELAPMEVTISDFATGMVHPDKSCTGWCGLVFSCAGYWIVLPLCKPTVCVAPCICWGFD